TKILFAQKDLAQNVDTTVTQVAYSPIYKYDVNYLVDDDEQGYFKFARHAVPQGGGDTPSYKSLNPAIMASPIAAQFGGYLTQLNSYDEAFRNLDMKMLMTREERKALRMRNSYASEVSPRVFSPTYLPEKDSAGWFRPYATFEKVDLRGGPKVNNVMYGSFFGGDSEMYTTKNGWDYQYSVYVGYNGSHQAYSGNDIYQNGGNLGATGIWYKDNFFTALTANVGASVAEASTMYGHEDFPMLMTGVASKTGYNWELAKGKFIIQPNYLMSYTFVNTFDYTNGAGVRIKSDPLHAINITPGVKFIGNLKNGWQPYLSVQMVWNIMDKTDFTAANVDLPDMSVKPYIQYGVGLQKRWGERFTGFFQTMFRNGGRNGVALSAGFRWALGKDPDKVSEKNNGADSFLPDMGRSGGVLTSQHQANSTVSTLTRKSDFRNAQIDFQPSPKGRGVDNLSTSQGSKILKQLQNDKLSNGRDVVVRKTNTKMSNLKTKIDIFFAKMNGGPNIQKQSDKKVAVAKK
ncbi:MAG: autotransporter outer membrane beta-barrel domain-containing protein, partial [Cyanobacteriota bacterium]|nr:autotransporter outer membrane beta-barrel domain-containing protein [Cyanobacteriota bacterium]